MWLLKRLNDGVTKYLISESKSYTVGRKNCDIVLEDDASISRKHCTIYIAKQSECPFPVNTLTGVWLVDEKSKYGTFLMNTNDWIKINPNENKKLTSGSVVKFGLMGNIWSFEFKPVVACASGIPTDQKKNIETTLQSIDGFLRNAWCKECSLVIVNEITLTVKVVLALINGVPIVTPNYVEKLVESVKNQAPLPSLEDYRPVIKETILDKALVSLDTKNHRKELFKGLKFVIPTKKQLETLKEVITSAGGSCELLSSSGKWERFAEDNVVVIQLPLNQTGIPENLCKSFKEISVLLKNKFGKRIVPESEIAQAIAYSSTEKFCNPKSTCFTLKVGERKQADLGPVIVEETPITAEDSGRQSQLGVVPSSETVGSEPHLNRSIQPEPSVSETMESQKHGKDTPKPSSERKRTHSPSQGDHNFQKKKTRNKTNDDDDMPMRGNQSSITDNKAEESSSTKQANPTKPSYITSYFQKQNKPPAEKAPQLIRQTSSNFWDFDSGSSKSSKRKISTESDDSVDSSSSSRKKPKLPEPNISKRITPQFGIDTPREVVEVLDESRSSTDTVPFPPVRKPVAEEDEDRTGYFGKDITDNEDLQMDELNNTIFSLTIISPAYINKEGNLIDPPSVPVNVKRFRKQKILSSVLSSLAEQDEELSDGEWIEPHSGRFNVSVAEGND